MTQSSADRLRAALKAFFARMKQERKLSRYRICKKAGVGESTVRGFLAGDYKSMQYDTLEKLAGAVDLTVQQMLGEAAEAAQTPATPTFDLERMRALLAGVHGVLSRGRIELAPQDYADMVLALYGDSARDTGQPFAMTPEIERLIMLYARRK